MGLASSAAGGGVFLVLSGDCAGCERFNELRAVVAADLAGAVWSDEFSEVAGNYSTLRREEVGADFALPALGGAICFVVTKSATRRADGRNLVANRG